jgi:hypothetical protein
MIPWSNSQSASLTVGLRYLTLAIILWVRVMQIVICLIATWYVAVAAMLFSAWYRAFQRDLGLSDQERRLSWIALLVPTVFWVFCLPLNYLELLRKRQQAAALEAYANHGAMATADRGLSLSKRDPIGAETQGVEGADSRSAA